jgi:hypothetical protein
VFSFEDFESGSSSGEQVSDLLNVLIDSDLGFEFLRNHQVFWFFPDAAPADEPIACSAIDQLTSYSIRLYLPFVPFGMFSSLVAKLVCQNGIALNWDSPDKELPVWRYGVIGTYENLSFVLRLLGNQRALDLKVGDQLDERTLDIFRLVLDSINDPRVLGDSAVSKKILVGLIGASEQMVPVPLELFTLITSPAEKTNSDGFVQRITSLIIKSLPKDLIPMTNKPLVVGSTIIGSNVALAGDAANANALASGATNSQAGQASMLRSGSYEITQNQADFGDDLERIALLRLVGEVLINARKLEVAEPAVQAVTEVRDVLEGKTPPSDRATNLLQRIKELVELPKLLKDGVDGAVYSYNQAVEIAKRLAELQVF